MITRIQELPRLGTAIYARTPSGRRYRWGEDEPDPENRPTGTLFGSGMPGGDQQLQVSLPRKSDVDYADLDRFTEIEVEDAAGDKVWSGYLERAARVSGDRLEVSPDAIGWQGYLEDEQGINLLGIDPRLSQWGELWLSRKIGLGGAGYGPFSGPQGHDHNTLLLSIDRLAQAGGVGAIAGMAYTAPSPIGRVEMEAAGYNKDMVGDNWRYVLRTTTSDDGGTGNTDDEKTTPPTAGTTFTVEPTNQPRFASFFIHHTDAWTGDGPWQMNFRPLVVGDHNISLHDAIGGGQGLLASDVIAYALTKWAPQLHHSPDTIMQSDFVIPVVVEEDTTVRGIIESVDKFQVWDWACWGKTFHYRPQGVGARRWKARVGPSNLQEAGKDVQRLVNGVRVRFTDVDGTQKTVGPTGGGDQVESDYLIDPDPLNEANQARRRRWHVVRMRSYGTVSSAIETGRRYMEMLKRADRSGTATITGFIANHAGVLYPHTSIRAGDYIEFIDASDRSPRRISDVQHNRDARESTVTLDAPPEGLDAILERLDIVLEGVVG